MRALNAIKLFLVLMSLFFQLRAREREKEKERDARVRRKESERDAREKTHEKTRARSKETAREHRERAERERKRQKTLKNRRRGKISPVVFVTNTRARRTSGAYKSGYFTPYFFLALMTCTTATKFGIAIAPTARTT